MNKSAPRDMISWTVSLSELPRAFGRRWAALASPLMLGLALGCTETLEAGATRPHGLLPVDERNPLVLVNDGATDNWQGEYAVLLANGGGPPLAGVVVDASPAWPDIDENVTSWRSLVAAARESGLQNIPDPIVSVGSSLVKPASGRVEDTVPNRSEGARLIIARAAELALPYRPVVVATGTRLTDVADAYLMDPRVADQIVVVASLGSLSATGATMSNPNGEMDPWADLIVSTRLRYVQVSAFYDQRSDLPEARLPELPNNAFGSWLAAKRADIFSIEAAADQVSVLAAGLPGFAAAVSRVDAPGTEASRGGPDLLSAPRGRAWLVTQSDGDLAAARFWEHLNARDTFEN